MFKQSFFNEPLFIAVISNFISLVISFICLLCGVDSTATSLISPLGSLIITVIFLIFKTKFERKVTIDNESSKFNNIINEYLLRNIAKFREFDNSNLTFEQKSIYLHSIKQSLDFVSKLFKRKAKHVESTENEDFFSIIDCEYKSQKKELENIYQRLKTENAKKKEELIHVS